MFLKTEGINLKTINYSESSQILIIFSKEHGKMSLLAKGVKKSSRSYKGKLQTFMHNQYLISKKTSMGIISQIDSIHPFLDLPKDYDKLSIAYQCIDLIHRIIQENHPYPDLFDIVLNTLIKIESTKITQDNKVLKDFKKQLLQHEGMLNENSQDHHIELMLNQYIGKTKVVL